MRINKLSALSFILLAGLVITLCSEPAFAAVDLNTASESELTEIPGVGPVMARKIIAYRDAHGGFKSVQELRKVKGVGEKTYAKIAPHVTVSGAAGNAPKAPSAAARSKPRANEASAAAPEPIIPPERILPETAVSVTCYSCRGVFWINNSISEGWCPYCGVHWKAVP